MTLSSTTRYLAEQQRIQVLFSVSLWLKGLFAVSEIVEHFLA